MNNRPRKTILIRFGQRVKQLRKEQKITQSQLAFEAELSREEISRIELGKKNAGLDTNLALSIGFGITLKELFDFDSGVNDGSLQCEVEIISNSK